MVSTPPAINLTERKRMNGKVFVDSDGVFFGFNGTVAAISRSSIIKSYDTNGEFHLLCLLRIFRLKLYLQ